MIRKKVQYLKKLIHIFATRLKKEVGITLTTSAARTGQKF
jgi:hypothetical protein